MRTRYVSTLAAISILIVRFTVCSGCAGTGCAVTALRHHPAQVWARYPGPHPAFVITSLKGEGPWTASSTHRVDVYTAKQAFDPNGTDFLLDEYEAGDAFAYVLGVPAFLAHAKAQGLTWTTWTPPSG